jgi:hypothetical protein
MALFDDDAVVQKQVGTLDRRGIKGNKSRAFNQDA